MKKLLIIFTLVLITLIGFYIYKNYYLTGAINEAISLGSPPNKTIKELISQGGEVPFPLSIEKGLKIGVFADLGNGKPRVLTLDPREVVVSSLTNEGKIVALPDTNGDGIADRQVVVLDGLDKPHGIAFKNGYLYVGESGHVSRYQYNPDNFQAVNKQSLFDLPGGGRHFTRTIKILDDKLYTSVGSSCDTCLENDQKRATILVSNLDGSSLEVFAKGLRNTVFFDFDKNGRIWGNDMGRDFLGDSLPPDELNIIEKGDYGWPYCYGAGVRDDKFNFGDKPDYCQNTRPPVFSYPAHVAPLGITFIDSLLFDPKDQGNLLVSFHGSWNSTEPVGYKVVKLNIKDNKVTSMEDLVTGFIKNANVLGRPVDLMFNNEGYLFISDDKSGLVYIVSKNK